MTAASLEHIARELLKLSTPPQMRNGVPVYTLVLDPSIPPEEVAAVQQYLDSYDSGRVQK